MDTNWHVQDNTEQQLGKLRVDSNEGCVCVVGENTRELQVDDERRRIAHLIAAAPVLLESLRMRMTPWITPKRRLILILIAGISRGVAGRSSP